MKFNQTRARVEQARAEPNVSSTGALNVKVMKFNQATEPGPCAGKRRELSYIVKPKAGYGDLATTAHYAAESSTGTNKDEEYKFAYPNLPFDVIGGRAMKSSALTLTIVNNQGTGDVEYGKVYDVYFPPS